MDCTEARTHLLDRRRGSLPADLKAQVDAHLAECPACRHEDTADAQLSVLLEQRLSRPRAPDALKRALEERWREPVVPPTVKRRWAGAGRIAAAMVMGAALACAALLAYRARAPDGMLVAEAVNDHLRVLYSDHPLEVESGGIHRVKPWFEGRLDFAPIVDFAGNDDFPLEGGSVGYFVDRKAATFVFKHRLHEITLFVFRAEGLPWPVTGLRPIGAAHGTVATSRGFHVAMWRQGDLGYALVSDVNETDLLALAANIAVP
ncbi:MAG TPA: zf-HC2 domain-containing protein [Polyangiaceae bacterium]|jgi:anti-sigma factor RsiW|nr:zf-HC2 domain-containing protein [Polyangiaceae bacterium]